MAAANATAATAAATIGRVGLSGSGFLIFFLLGALMGLEERGAMVRPLAGVVGGGGPSVPAIDEQTVFAGSSGGAILSIVSCLGVPYRTVLREAHLLADRCAARNDCALTLDAELRRTLASALAAAQPTLGEGGVAKAVERCRGKAFVNMSVFAPEGVAELHEDREGYRGKARGGGRRTSTGTSNSTSASTDTDTAAATSAGGPPRRTNDALLSIGLEYRPGSLLCSAMEVRAVAKLSPFGMLAQRLVPPGLGLHPRPWLVGDWRSAEDAIDGAAASSFNALLSALSPVTSFRGVPLVADGVYTVPLPAPPVEAAPSRGGGGRGGSGGGGGGGGGGVVRIASVPDGFAVAPGSAKIYGADIWPGKRTGGDLAGLGSVEAWLCHVLVVPDAATRGRMVELGRREAALFLDERAGAGSASASASASGG